MNPQGGRDSNAQELSAKIDSLRVIIDERDKLYTARFDSAEKSVQIALAAAKEAVNAALSAAKEAVTKAEIASEKRFDAVNEFRRTLADQQTTFSRSDVMESKFHNYDQRIDELSKRFQSLSDSVTAFHAQYGGREKGISDFWGYIAGAIGIIIAAAALIFKP